MNWDALGQRLLTTLPGRRLADSLLRSRLRQRVRALDRATLAGAQLRILRGLVQRARETRFGQDHNFARIRTLEDFQRLVPLRSVPQMWQEYGAAALPQLEGVTWPAPIYYLATCETEGNQPIIPVPVSSDLVACHRDSLLTALALALVDKPQARLLAGTLLLVGGGIALTSVRGHSYDSLEELARRQMPALMRPFTMVASQSGNASFPALAERVLPLSVTCLAGHTTRLVALIRELQTQTGCQNVVDLWPQLQVVLYVRGSADPDRAQLEALLTSARHPAPVFLEVVLRPEGILAIEDPRHRLLRFLPDAGVFYEFVPLDQLNALEPERVPLQSVTPGVPYALAISSAAGMWACLTGTTVTFAQTEPPLVRTLERTLPPVPLPVILPLLGHAEGLPAHRQPHGGSRGEHPKRFARTPWSARADQR